MTKSDLINEVSKALKTKKEAQASVNAIIEVIINALQNKDEVKIAGFGTFKTVKTKARMGMNPQTQKPIKIPAKNRVRFVVSEVLKKAVVK